MSSKLEAAIAALAEQADDEYGWLSDAQDAQLDYHEDLQAISFCGEGSIDLHHMVGVVADALGVRLP